MERNRGQKRLCFTGAFPFIQDMPGNDSFGNVVKFNKENSPVLSASKQISFVAAFMSMYVLQTAMINTFGGEDSGFRRIANMIGGAVVLTVALVNAVRMLIYSTKELRRMKAEEKYL